MLQEFVYNVPLWLLGTLIVAASLAFVAVSIALTRWSGLVLDADDMGAATVLHAFVSVLYAVALALIVVDVQSQFSAVEDAALMEASKLSDLYRNLDGLTGEERPRVQEHVKQYVDLVIEKEWPANNAGKASEETIVAIDSLAREVIQLHPTTPTRRSSSRRCSKTSTTCSMRGGSGFFSGRTACRR